MALSTVRQRRVPGSCRPGMRAVLVAAVLVLQVAGQPPLVARADGAPLPAPRPAVTQKKRKREPFSAPTGEPYVKGTYLLSRNTSSEARILPLKRLGVVCTHCCFIPKEHQTKEQRARKGQDFFLWRGKAKESNDGVRLWAAGPHEHVLPGVTHVAWLMEHSNLLFNIAAASNAWRTWWDIDLPVDRVMLLRRPRPDFEWMFNQLHGLRDLPPPLPVREPLCFETLVLGLVREPLRPFDWLTKCQRHTRMTREESAVLGGFSAYIREKIPENGVAGLGPLDGTQRCRALVQLRGARQGPAREVRGRNWLNSQAAAEALREVGFHVDAIDLRATSLERAAILHHAADLVVAPHGAGMANTVFCRPGTTIVELQNFGAQKWVYARMAKSLGFKYRPHFCEEPSQCPLFNRKTGEQVKEYPKRDKCRRGVYVRRAWYESNHTRDINVDVATLQRTAIRVAMELRSANKCHIDIPFMDGLHEHEQRPPSLQHHEEQQLLTPQQHEEQQQGLWLPFSIPGLKWPPQDL